MNSHYNNQVEKISNSILVIDEKINSNMRKDVENLVYETKKSGFKQSLPRKINKWNVKDNFDNLFLFETSDININHNVRGFIVDKQTQKIVAKSFEFPVYTYSNIDFENFVDSEFKRGNFVALKPYCDGLTVRVFKNNGKVFFSSHNKIKIDTSKRGTEKTFLEMLKESIQPLTLEQFGSSLFNEKEPNSSSCYVFILSHPENLAVTQNKFLKPELFFISRFDLDNGFQKGIFDPMNHSENCDWYKTPKVFKTFEESISYLKGNIDIYGNKTTFSHKSGECLVAHVFDKNMNLIKTNGIISIEYQWRKTIRADNSSLENQYWRLLSNADFFNKESSNFEFLVFRNNFDFFDEYQLLDIYNGDGDKHFELEFKIGTRILSYEQIVFSISLNYYMALPHELKKQFAPMMFNFKQTLRTFSEKLKCLEKEAFADKMNVPYILEFFKNLDMLEYEMANRSVFLKKSSIDELSSFFYFYRKKSQLYKIYKFVNKL
jgi:hypothetical protein